MYRAERAFAAMAFAVALLASSCNCSNNKCGPNNCPGCCDSAGTCQGGFLTTHCGSAGVACAECALGQMCAAGHCGLISTGGGNGTGGGFGTGGGNGTGGGFSVGGGGGSNSFCQQYSTAYCDYVIRCGQAASSARSDCISFLTTFYCSALQSVNKGYQTINTANASACINFINSASCATNPTTSSSTACSDLTTAHSGPGQGCFSSSDCTDPTDGCGGTNACMLTCQASGPLGAPCPCNDGLRCDYTTGICAAPHNVGETCQPYLSFECVDTAKCDPTSKTCVALPSSGPCYLSSYCAPDAYCSFSGGTSTCQPRVGQDQSCTGSNCLPGLWCNYNASGGPKCQPLLAQGSSCSSNSGSCQTGLNCLNGLCEPPGGVGAACKDYSYCLSSLECDSVLRTCEKFTSQVVQGATCTGSTLYCAYPDNCRGAVINPDGGVGATGICSPVMLGDPCSSLSSGCPPQAYCQLVDAGVGTCVSSGHGTPCGSNSDCLSGDYCGSSDTCVPLGTTGQPCYGSGSCASGLQCVSQSADGGLAGLCGTLGGLGASCAGASSCLFPYTCVNGQCASSGHTNEPCLGGFACFNGACQQDAGTTGFGLCTGTKRADGQPCFYPSDCQSGYCQGFSVCAPTCP